jgi:predicted adenylyl cyclase CyaB
LSTSEHILVELKARVTNHTSIREKLRNLKARHLGTFHQTDIYFDTPKGRLKLRQFDNQKTQLIYYERENLFKPKRSHVFVLELPESKAIVAFLKKILKVKATVKKTREIYLYQRTQIHLDSVDSLGYYVEFERGTPNTKKEMENSVKILERLMETLEINPKNLEKSSYSDLVGLK